MPNPKASKVNGRDGRQRAVRKAKVLDKAQFAYLIKHIIPQSDHPLRDEVALRLSFFAALRSCEIAGLRWKNNLLDAKGRVRDEIHITADISKRAVERVIPIDKNLKPFLVKLREQRPNDEFVFFALHNYNPPMVVKTDRLGRAIRHKADVYEDGKLIAKKDSPVKVQDPKWTPGRVSPNAVVQFFKRLYAKADLEGCSSHSGRRTFITVRTRLANLKKCSVRDVQILAGHRSLETTAGYIEPSEQQRDLVGAW